MSDTTLIQERLGVSKDGNFRQQTAEALQSYQRSHGLAETGNPDPMTLAEMGVYDPIAGAPSEWREHYEGGERPGTFGRDVVTAMNQIPRWGWLTMGVAFGGLAFFSWWRRGRGAG